MRGGGAGAGQLAPAAAPGPEAAGAGAVARTLLRCRCAHLRMRTLECSQHLRWSENDQVFPPSHHCDDGHLRRCEHSRVRMRKWAHLSLTRAYMGGVMRTPESTNRTDRTKEQQQQREKAAKRVGLVYMFNLIVGTGALTMPKAFASAGWLVSLVLLVFLAFMSFVTTTFVIEAMAAANAQLRWKRLENRQEEEGDDSSSASDSDALTQDSYERAEKRPILSVQFGPLDNPLQEFFKWKVHSVLCLSGSTERRGSQNLFEITDRVEMGQMASIFFNKVGVNLFYFCIIIYLYGDLAIYAAAVPLSLMQVTCSAGGNDSCGVEANAKHNDTDPCWGPLRRVDAYRIYLVSDPQRVSNLARTP
ncbi:Transmembrane protein 104 [Galemys pyrenaicus]|uniref:Transmembrane protein 104 n=1 Tax=Galemys pyrenaicus TaxID=202257 RepID=A0A8J5ZZ34_GALPY|nr:Transmembrane protein 104 [Galemys pyrenaicus]